MLFPARDAFLKMICIKIMIQIQEHLDQGAWKKPIDPIWGRFHWFPSYTMIRVILYEGTGNTITVACNQLSTRVTKTCSAGQSKFKVLIIKLQSLPAHLGTFWRHATSTWREAKSATPRILSFMKIRIKESNRGISVGFLLWYFTICRRIKEKVFTSTLCARYLAEDLHFLSESTLTSKGH